MGGASRWVGLDSNTLRRTCEVGTRGVTAYATGRQMGTHCQVRATCADAAEALAAVDVGWQQITECEQLWSRFIPDSELSCLNNSANQSSTPVEVSELTALLISAMLWAYSYSSGWVDASLLPQIIAAGYDRDFSQISKAPTTPPVWTPIPGVRNGTSPRARMDSVSLEDRRLIRSEPVALDSGGVGKGLAADVVAQAIVDAGADGALVNLGGDIRAIGCDQYGRPWTVQAFDERQAGPGALTEWDVEDAGVATSSTARRRWNGGHHLIDPHTGIPSKTDVLAVTVVHKDALTAETAAKTALLMGRCAGISWLQERGTTAVITARDGSITRLL